MQSSSRWQVIFMVSWPLALAAAMASNTPAPTCNLEPPPLSRYRTSWSLLSPPGFSEALLARREGIGNSGQWSGRGQSGAHNGVHRRWPEAEVLDPGGCT